jgi:ABC-type lipoprotein export system ATPase subunit
MLAECRSLSKTYNRNGKSIRALDDVTLQIDSGQFIALRGKSGCGKSTLLLASGGLLRPDSGNVSIDGTDVYRMSPDQRAAFRAGRIGFVFQQFHLVPYLSVLDNVLAARLGMNDDRPSVPRERAEHLINQLGLSGRRNHRPGELSTGECQRAALARAMLNQPTLVLADEPTGNLDGENAEIVLKHLAEFAASGGAILLVTHDDRAAGFADRTLSMADGRILDG